MDCGSQCISAYTSLFNFHGNSMWLNDFPAWVVGLRLKLDSSNSKTSKKVIGGYSFFLFSFRLNSCNEEEEDLEVNVKMTLQDEIQRVANIKTSAKIK